jgi:hypothetical protein
MPIHKIYPIHIWELVLSFVINKCGPFMSDMRSGSRISIPRVKGNRVVIIHLGYRGFGYIAHFSIFILFCNIHSFFSFPGLFLQWIIAPTFLHCMPKFSTLAAFGFSLELAFESGMIVLPTNITFLLCGQ